ncbi:MAG: hypothetical protein PHF86_12900 [Candidatus Nanoarchaeia archaeon]|jgi:hypothetical protein|nr:hypothetical protein [Candidatus Nanoarchaeia archaeon]
MSGVRSIWFNATLKGTGIVNYDGKDSLWAAKEWFKNYREILSHSNVKMAKHYIKKIGEKDGKPEYEIKIKISSDCIKHALFEEDQPVHDTLIMAAPKAFIKLLSSACGLIRGYMFENKVCGSGSVHRKGPLNITDAVQTNDTIPTFDLVTQLSPKRQKENKDDISGTNMVYKECIGDVVYTLSGSIDLNLLQFICCSQRYNRMAVNPDDAKLYIEGVNRTTDLPTSNIGHYIYKTAKSELSEEGILLSQDQCLMLIKDCFRRLLGLNIGRGGGGFAYITDIKIKHITDPIIDKPYEEVGYYPIKSVDDIKLKASDIEVFYKEIPEEEAIALNNDIDNAYIATKNKDAEDKQIKAEEKIKAKEAKEAKKNKKSEQ